MISNASDDGEWDIVGVDIYNFYSVRLKWYQKPWWWVRVRVTAIRYWWEDR